MQTQFIRAWFVYTLCTAGLVVHGESPRPLFDGKSLEGFNGDHAYFRVEDGCLVAGKLDRRIPHNFFLCTNRSFADFELTFEAKLVGEGNNAGVQFRTKRIPGSTEVSGYQADIGRAWNRSVWGALYDESRRKRMLAEPGDDVPDDLAKEGQWNRMRVIARGNHIEIFLNEVQTVDYREMDSAIDDKGVIAFQIHSGPPAEAWYRNIRIRELSAD